MRRQIRPRDDDDMLSAGPTIVGLSESQRLTAGHQVKGQKKTAELSFHTKLKMGRKGRQNKKKRVLHFIAIFDNTVQYSLFLTSGSNKSFICVSHCYFHLSSVPFAFPSPSSMDHFRCCKNCCRFPQQQSVQKERDWQVW